jgi:peptidoglycan hydrolase-like protein with peptidoglycan-binding domain
MNPISTSTSYTISEPLTRTLRYRTWGEDVAHLQEVLAQDSTIYPERLVTGYFGPLTRAAVQAVQNKWNIVTSSDAGYGIFGPKTLAKVREQWGW